jgi:hypothetical protein
LEKPIGAATFTSNTQKVVVKKVVVANKRSVKSENEDLIVAVFSRLSLSLSATETQTKATKQCLRGGRFRGKTGRKKREKREASWIGFNTLNFIEAKFNERREILTKKDAKDDDDARWWRSFFFSVLSSRGVARPSPTQRGLFVVVFVVVEEKGFFEHSECDDDSDERSDFGIDDAMVFVLFVVFKLEGEE